MVIEHVVDTTIELLKEIKVINAYFKILDTVSRSFGFRNYPDLDDNIRKNDFKLNEEAELQIKLLNELIKNTQTKITYLQFKGTHTNGE